MVAIETRREVAEYKHNGQTYRAGYNPDDIEDSIRRLVSLGGQEQMPWFVIAALRIAMINQTYPHILKAKKKHAKRIG